MRAGDTYTVHNSSDDDFGVPGQHIESVVVDDTYRYGHHNIAWRLMSAFVYYIIAPIPVFIMGKAHGLRFVNRRALSQAPGCYMYGNHTHWLDAVIPYLMCFPKRAWVVIGPTAVSVRGLRVLVEWVGGVPLNTTEQGKAAFREFLDEQIKRGGRVAIYPEAHEWPYYNGVRDFSSRSFTYPVRTSTPVFSWVVTYRKRPVFKSRAPHMTATVSQQFDPSLWVGADDPKGVTRDAVYQFMSQTIQQQKSYAWVEYVADGSDDHSQGS